MKMFVLTGLICCLASAAQATSIHWQDASATSTLAIENTPDDTALENHAQPHGSDSAAPLSVALLSARLEMTLTTKDLQLSDATTRLISAPPVLDVNPNWLN